MQIDELDIRRIKDAAGILDVIRDFIPNIRKCGVDYECLCPFHADRKMGSFKISPKRNMYHCFSCGAAGGPVDFLMDYANMTFPDAICYLGAKYGMPIYGGKEYHPQPAKPHEPLPELPTLVLPTQFVKSKQYYLEDDTLCKWIHSLPWNEQQRERIGKVLKNYLIGHGKDDYTIFWQMNEQGQLLTGKMIKYNEDGHRKKEKYATSWIHTKLFASGWYDENKVAYKTTYFGMHLIDFFPNATINIVESEKTALICSIYWGHPEINLWIACGGMSMLTRERMMPLIERGRRVSLFPDHDGLEMWTKQAEQIGYDGINIQSSFIKKYWCEEDGPKADLADILVRLLNNSRACKVQQVGEVIKKMAATKPALNKLITKLQLTPVIP